MLQLKNIVKNYVMGDMTIQALKGVNLEFRKNDFVSILGPSGCGKTTMLNIIGGLDRYTSGDLVINGVSTKEYKSVDWDIYRNKSIGFVFQSYNLISHQTVYTNVELSLTLSGISAKERKRRVIEALEKVGLGDQLKKKPTQMSGGQMQRVAIARALVNNPDILLADEPTGALDSETSVQIMELLKEIAKDRLVIMVTHNPELAMQYSTRVIRMLDGNVIDDGAPYESGQETMPRQKGRRKKTFMSYFTALSLSMKNLWQKKARTLLTAFAGSIGIIGIALILSLSSGMQGYVNDLEQNTLSTYPLEITSQSMDMGSMISVMMENRNDKERGDTEVYANNIMTNMIQAMTAQIKKNDLAKFKQYIEDSGAFEDYTNTVQYGYDVELQIFGSDTSDGAFRVNPSEVMESLNGGNSAQMNGMSMMGGGSSLWSELIDNQELLDGQYDVVAGKWPKAFDEVVLVMNKNNEVSDVELYSLGLLDPGNLKDLMTKAMRGQEMEEEIQEERFSYEEILSTKFKLLINPNYYVKKDGIWEDRSDNDTHMKWAVEEVSRDIKIVGIIRPAEGTTVTSIQGTIGYTSALTDYVITKTLETDIVKEQLADPDTNVFTGIAFDVDNYIDNLTIDDVKAMVEEIPEEERAQVQMMFEMMPEEEIIAMFAAQIQAELGKAVTYEDNVEALGIADLESPSVIKLYPKDFDSKKRVEELITEYNEIEEAAGREENVIDYTDIVGIMTSSIASIINIISYVLISFVAISLVVSSIMIAIITYISVLERTKEIGILRSLGASKKDITRVFNAETIIEGFVAGTMGVLITTLLNIPINAVILSLTEIKNLSALPVYGAIGLVVISMILTVIAGFIPSKMAAKKDPVVALRTE